MGSVVESEKGLMIYSSPKEFSEEGWDFENGDVFYKDIKKPIELIYEEDPTDTPHDNIITMGLTGLLVSKKCMEILYSIEVDNVQFFEAILKNKADGKELQDYYFANIVGIYSIVDQSNSDLKYSAIDGRIKRILSLSLIELDEDDYPTIFRLKELPRVVVVKDKVKNAFCKAGVSGFRFYKPSDFKT